MEDDAGELVAAFAAVELTGQYAFKWLNAAVHGRGPDFRTYAQSWPQPHPAE